ncbi:IS91 family transposase [Effusibacillus lacus]|uniref:IS91 family transposase n=1 Tax=Effusibacillus lacus TaxID=1348429 RepID=UPI003C7BC786
METNELKRIFFDEHRHWEQFVAKHGKRIRPQVIKEVEKFRICGTMHGGFKLFACEGCGHMKFVPYRCKGRFCTTCSNGETEEWSKVMEQELLTVPHRHVVFTMDERLWPLFCLKREMLKALMDEAAKLLQDWFLDRYKVTIGIVMGLHTFGSRMNFNPHVHMLVTEGGMKADGEFKRIEFIPFEMLRKRWQAAVLSLIRGHLNQRERKKYRKLLDEAYRENPDGFYVHAPKRKGNVQKQLQYIGRYMRRPAISLKRIVKYDGKTVTFSYVDKTDGEEKFETLTVEEFITRIIRHIPDEHFKSIRHYGIYSRRSKKMWMERIEAWWERTKKWLKKMAKEKRVTVRWREKMFLSWGADPLACPKCKQEYFEYKGEVCLQDGRLKVKYAVCETARKRLEEMIQDVSGFQTRQERKKEKESKHQGKKEQGGQLHLLGLRYE